MPAGLCRGRIDGGKPLCCAGHDQKLAGQYGDKTLPNEVQTLYAELIKESARFFTHDKVVHDKSVLRLDRDLSKAITKLNRLEAILAKLPEMDCGACGSPTCRSLAEDIVQGIAQLTDCIFILREQLVELAQRHVALARDPTASDGLEQRKGGGRRMTLEELVKVIDATVVTGHEKIDGQDSRCICFRSLK